MVMELLMEPEPEQSCFDMKMTTLPWRDVHTHCLAMKAIGLL